MVSPPNPGVELNQVTLGSTSILRGAEPTSSEDKARVAANAVVHVTPRLELTAAGDTAVLAGVLPVPRRRLVSDFAMEARRRKGECFACVELSRQPAAIFAFIDFRAAAVPGFPAFIVRPPCTRQQPVLAAERDTNGGSGWSQAAQVCSPMGHPVWAGELPSRVDCLARYCVLQPRHPPQQQRTHPFRLLHRQHVPRPRHDLHRRARRFRQQRHHLA